MRGYYKTLCILLDKTVLPYHAAVTIDSMSEISDELKYIGVGYIFATGDKSISYNSGVKYRFYVSTVPKRLKIKKRLLRDLVNELRNTKRKRKRR